MCPGASSADPDVMDTWATSSLTPQIAGGWVDDEDLFARVFPYDLRPQGPEIIRTWLFATVLRSHQEHGVLPWAHATINGWILDPDRKKMSKSTGNTLEPADFVARFGADGFRYWSCRSGLGVDTAVDEGQMRVGRRLATKLLNVARFVLGLGVTGVGPVAAVTEPLDRSLLDGLARIAAERHRRVRGLRVPAGPRRRRDVLLDVLRRLRRAREGPRLRGRARRRLGRGRARARAGRPAAPARARAALRHRGGLVVVADGVRAPGAVAGAAGVPAGRLGS